MKLKKEKFKDKFGDWWRYIEPIFDTDIMDNIYKELKLQHEKGKIICPEHPNTFNTFLATSPTSLHTVFLLLDPYPTIHKDVMVSNGIALDCSNTGKLQPSLEKWYEAIEESECKGLNLSMVRDPSLKFYYDQGMMFLNTALTVEYNKTGSHSDLWRPFTAWLIEEVFNKYFQGLTFVLCGAESQKFEKYIAPLQHYVFKLEHPSFANRQMRMWKHDGIFKKINRILKDNNNMEVNWVMEEAPF